MSSKEYIIKDYSTPLYKKASSILKPEFESVYRMILPRLRKKLPKLRKESGELSTMKLEEFESSILSELGIDPLNGDMPFSNNSINWGKYEKEA